MDIDMSSSRMFACINLEFHCMNTTLMPSHLPFSSCVYLSKEERDLVKSGKDELRLFLFEFTEHRVFNVSILFVIFLNTIFIGLQTSEEITAKSGTPCMVTLHMVTCTLV